MTAPSSGRVYHHDARTPGLTLCVTAAGSKVFYFYKWMEGRPERIRLGKFGEVTLDSARKAAVEWAGKVAGGKVPAAERRAKRESPTLGELFDHWWEVHSKPHKKTWADDERMFKKYLRKYKTRRLAKITKAHVQRWHAKWGDDHGPYMANRVRALLSAMYDSADDLEYAGPNPCTGVRKFKEESRERFLLPDEMEKFFKALAEEEDLWRDFFLLLLLTGAWRGNVAEMRWDKVDLGRAVWYLPGTEAKGGAALAVVLPEPAVAILQARREADPGGEWVFPSKVTSGPIDDPRKAWARIRKRSGLTDLRMHDLRRSLGSWQAAMGTSLQIVGKSLGHRDMKATQVYARLQLDPVRKSVEAATSAMLKVGGNPKIIDVESKGEDDGY